MIEISIAAQVGGPNVRDDLKPVVSEWHDLPVPAMLGASADYLRKMHASSFETYRARLNRLTAGGATALDAGCGTGTWSIALADLFDRVIAVDRARARVDCARWLVDRAGTQRIDVDYGDITDLDLAPNTVDFVFCYSVIISALSLRQVLRELMRVTKPGGEIYVGLNGLGWSRHLRDERGQRSKTSETQGRRAFYNTICQTEQGQTNRAISRLVAQIAKGGTVARAIAEAIGVDAVQLEQLVEGCIKAKTLAGISLPDGRAIDPHVMAEMVDTMLDAAGLKSSSPLAQSLERISRECGVDYVEQFGNDLVNLIAGRAGGFSYATAGRGYSPEEVECVCQEIGLTGFRWAPDAKLVGFDGNDVEVSPFYNATYGGELGVWEFMVKVPDTATAGDRP